MIFPMSRACVLVSVILLLHTLADGTIICFFFSVLSHLLFGFGKFSLNNRTGSDWQWNAECTPFFHGYICGVEMPLDLLLCIYYFACGILFSSNWDRTKKKSKKAKKKNWFFGDWGGWAGAWVYYVKWLRIWGDIWMIFCIFVYTELRWALLGRRQVWRTWDCIDDIFSNDTYLSAAFVLINLDMVWRCRW